MTEKRFEVYYDEYMEDWKVQDIITLQIIPCISESVAKELGKKLNEQHKKNKELKRAYNICKFRRMNDANEIYCLEKENEKLKEENEALYKQIDREYYMKYR